MSDTTTPFYRKFLKEELERRAEENPRYSLRAFADALDIHAGTLSRILAGKQVVSRNLAKRLVTMLDLNGQEMEDFLYSVFKADWLSDDDTSVDIQLK